jgi:hypothetical protein
MTKQFRLPLLGIALAVASLLTLSVLNRTASAAGVDTTRDCDETAIIHCGVMTLSELKTKYAANEAGDLPAIYKAFNVDTSFSGLVDGVVYRDGTVVVNGKTVATGAMTAARNLPGGDIAGSTANVISPSVWPAQYITGKPAFVKVVDGKFMYAVLKTCGNPVKATPTYTPPKPPAPTPTATCVSVQAIKKSRDSYDFKGTAATTNGATVSNYAFTVTHSSGSAKIVNVGSSALTATSGALKLEVGTHTVKLVVTTSLGAKTSAACQTTVTVPEEDKTVVCNPTTGEIITVPTSEASKYKPEGDIACKARVCNPATGEVITVNKSEVDRFKPEGDDACKDARVCDASTKQVITVPKTEADKYESEDSELCKVQGTSTKVVETPPTIASTGPADILMGGAGISSLTAAGYYWRASRRRLISTLLNR